MGRDRDERLDSIKRAAERWVAAEPADRERALVRSLESVVALHRDNGSRMADLQDVMRTLAHLESR